MCALRTEAEDDEDIFIRTGDVLCLFANERGYIAAEGFGSQRCRLVKEYRNKDLPCELSKCTLRLEDALSTHAMFTHGGRKSREKGGACSSRILMYGQAVLLQHTDTRKFLCCLPSSLENDKMAYQIGFGDYADNGTLNENCWFSVQPATAHRSPGEKVRDGDEVQLVNVANERYLSVRAEDQTASQEVDVQASIHQYVWSLHVVWSASVKQEAIGSLNGGDVIRLLHRHGEGCLSWDCRAESSEQEVCFTCADLKCNLSPLWSVELFTMRFGWGFVGWRQPFRLRHKITGKFLGQKDLQLVLLDPAEACVDQTAFCLISATNSRPVVSGEEGEEKDVPTSMGRPDVTYGDSVVYLYHISSQRWVGSLPSDQSRGLERRELLHPLQNHNFALTITRASYEHAHASTLIQSFQDTMLQYKNCVLLSSGDKATCSIEGATMAVLSHLCDYFKTPDATLSYDQYQSMVCILRERQNLFQHQGISLLTPFVILETSKNCTQKVSTAPKILRKFYALLSAMIDGNHGNCKVFATQQWLETFIAQLELSWLVDDVLDVLLCLLRDSPEFLNIFTDTHINAIVSLFNKEGRNKKVMKLLSSLCVCHDVAIRDNQQLICDHLMYYKDILLHTTMCQKIECAHLNVYVGVSSSGLPRRWYYEAKVTELNHSAHRDPPHLRVGWAHTTSFCAHPISVEDVVIGGGLGDDMYSVGYDGHACWVGGDPLNLLRAGLGTGKSRVGLGTGDVVGCCIDLEKGVVFFTLNGSQVPGYVRCGHLTELVTPSVSVSSGASVVMVLGGGAEKFKYCPPTGYSGLCDAVLPGKEVKVVVFDNPGDGRRLHGPLMISDSHGFVPTVIETKADIPDPVKCVQEQLAKNLHEVWSRNKIESGYTYGSVRNDKLKQHSCLIPYEDLPESEKAYDRSLALSTLKTLLALGYSISLDLDSAPDPPYFALDPSKYQQSNGYLPKPLDLGRVKVEPVLLSLVDKLAENLHNLWASSKIREGWTYGLASADAEKRNPALVPYACLSDNLKKSNYDSALETVRSLCGLGCTIEPPPTSCGGSSIHELRRTQADHATMKTRTFRAQRCYTLTHGRWCYEVKILTDDGTIRVGWATPTLPAYQTLGTDEGAYCFDGYLGSKWHQHSDNFGQRWKAGDIVCCMVDLDLKTIAFALNGKILEDELGSVYAFEHITAADGLVPAVMLSMGQEAELSFGQAKEFLHQSHANLGYLPLAKLSDSGTIPIWYSCPDSIFYPLSDAHPRLKATWDDRLSRVTVSHRCWDYSMFRGRPECLRLNVGVGTGTVKSPLPQATKVSYTAVIPAGHDPKTVFVGWTTSGFRYGEEEDQQSIRRPGVRAEWSGEEWTSELTSPPDELMCSSTAYLMCLTDALSKPQLSLMSPVSVACVLDSNKGDMSFYLVDSKYSSPVLTMTTTAPCKLFPTIIMISPMEHLVIIDHTPFAGCSPLSSVFLTPNCTKGLPLCPSRLKICALDVSRWLPYVSMETTVSTHLVPSEGISVALEGGGGRDTHHSIAVTMRDEGIAFSIFELIEYPDLLDFQLATLEAFSCVSSHGNLETGAAIAGVVDTRQLLHTVRLEGIDHSLKAAYFQLLSSLHLQPMVQASLLTKGELIVPLSRLTRSAAASTKRRKSSMSDALATWSPPSSSSSSSLSSSDNCVFPLDELKELVLESLKSILSKDYSVSLCPQRRKEQANPLVPLLHILDSLLVIGNVRHKADFDSLLELLDPSAFGKQGCGLLSLEIARDEAIKLALCNVLQHLCDRQVLCHVMDVISFAQGYVEQLRCEQERRYVATSWEFRSPTDSQLGYMLDFEAKGCPSSPSLQAALRDFCSNLSSQCSCLGGEEAVLQELQREEMALHQKLERLWEVIWHRKVQGAAPLNEITSLQCLIRESMLVWAKECIRNPSLVEKIFLLLFQQFDLVQEVLRAVKNAYIVDDANRLYDIPLFQHALGTLRSLVKVTMGKGEEKILKKSLNDIKESGLFYCHPSLMCSSGVHTAVIDILRHYVKMGTQSNGSCEQVEVCCKFLCSFARIGQDTQQAIFGHLGELLEFMKLSPALMAAMSCTPLDVATVAIRNNTELAMTLNEAHLESVVTLLLATTTSGEAWSPVGGKRCLEFLQCAVWSNNDQIQGNAYTLVRLLIRHSKCLGPALDCNGGLCQAFESNLRLLGDKLYSGNGEEGQNNPPSQMQSVLSYYAGLLQLLGYCCHGQQSTSVKEMSLEQSSILDRTRHILKNLVSLNDVTSLLLVPFDPNGRPLMLPLYKKASLHFVERVYGLHDPDHTLKLLTESFLPDIKLALQFLHQRSEAPAITHPLLCYLCDSVLPALTRHSNVIQQLQKHLHIFLHLLSSVYRMLYAPCLSLNQLDQISDFIIAVIRNLHPRFILPFARKVLSKRPFVQPQVYPVLKVFTAHYNRFAQFFGGGHRIASSGSTFAGEEEKMITAQVVYHFINGLQGEVPLDKQLVQEAVSCLKAMVVALPPDCHVPPFSTAALVPESAHGYEPHPPDISEVKLFPEIIPVVTGYAQFQHDCYIFEKQSEGWTYGTEFNAELLHDPRLVPFDALSQHDKDSLLSSAEQSLKLLLFRGWALNTVPPIDTRSIPRRVKNVCVLQKKSSDHAPYQPEVLDLSKLELSTELLALAERMAEDIHDFWAKQLSYSDSDYSSNPLYCSYELLDDHIKEQRVTYALDLIKYLGVLGFKPLPSSEMASFSFQSQASTAATKFGLELFDILTGQLSSERHSLNFLTSVMFPILSVYLSRYQHYFLRHRHPSVATKEERTKIIEMFFSLITFTSENKDTLFPLFASGTGGGASPTETSVVKLINAVAKIFDAQILKDNSKGSKAAGVLNATVVAFFKEASAVIQETTSGLLGHGDMTPASVYCLHALLPILTHFLKHLQEHHMTEDVIKGDVVQHCQAMFESLWSVAKKGTLQHTTSDPLAVIGQCLGALAVVNRLQEEGECSLSVLQERLENTGKSETKSDETSFTAFVVVPIVASVLSSKVIKKEEGVLEDPDVDQSLTAVWTLLGNASGAKSVLWLYQVVEDTHALTKACSFEVLVTRLLPLVTQAMSRAIGLYHEELLMWESEHKDQLKKVHESYRILARDLMAALSYLAAYLSAHQTTLRRDSSSSPLIAFFDPLADILYCWSHSQMFQRHLQSETQVFHQHIRSLLLAATKATSHGPVTRTKPVLLALCMHVILPLKMHTLSKGDRDLVDLYSEHAPCHAAKLTIDDLKDEITSVLEAKPSSSQLSRGRRLVRRFSSSFMINPELSLDARALQIAFISRAKRQLDQLETPTRVHFLWKQVITRRKKAAIVQCFYAVPFFKLKKPQAINSFLRAFCQVCHISDVQPTSHHVLARVLLSNKSLEDSRARTEPHPQDPLTQLFSTLKRSALSHDISCINEKLYTAYASLLSENVLDSVEGSDEDPMMEMYHLAKCTLVERQEQLSVRGAASVVTAMITATNGVICPIAYSTLKLGIVLLTEGNTKIQGEILGHLTSMDIGFLSSISRFIADSSVLDWSTYERQRQVGLMAADASLSVFPDHDFTISLFRFLQLLCEGHNLGFQNYLRTQSGKSTTLNIVSCTVDYLLRLQESITDFYHHYSRDAHIELAGRQIFSTAFKVAKQVTRTLTEYVQGPCVGNQQALASSRLWDAVSGFMSVFSVMQRHLYYLHTSHIELLRELLSLQEEQFVLLRSMLEGSALSSNTARLMVDTLMDTSSILEDIVSFFSIFVKLQDVAICDAFKSYDLNKDGFISRKEFQKALTAQQKYSSAEIEYLMDCADSNHDGILDYAEFTSRFHQPAQDIGFHLCVLIVQLSECLPQDKRLKHFRGSTAAIELVEHFKNYMGCVEIVGKSQRVERLYFELQENHMKQWENPQIQEAYKEFLHSADMSNQRAKLSDFVEFCEDTIYEIDNACGIRGSEEQMLKAKEVLEAHTETVPLPTHQQFISQPVVQRLRANGQHFVPSLLLMVWMLVLLGVSKMKRQGVNFVRSVISHLVQRRDSEGTSEGQEANSNQTAADEQHGHQQVASYLPKLSIFKQNWQGFFAYHYHGLTNVALVTTFLINLSILAFKVHPPTQLFQEDLELEDTTILPLVLALLALLHFTTSCAIVVSYCCLMVPVIIFKREKAIARNMSTEWLEKPPQSLSVRWDRLAATSKSFPRLYWDKQANKQASKRNHSGAHTDDVMGLIHSIVDIDYVIWAVGTILCNGHVIYRICYCAVSFLGLQFSVFFFAFHLLDFVHNFKLVRTVLRSVLHNGKQLLMTLVMTCVVIYIYTVVAFNFFREYYPKESVDVEGEELHSCNSMVRCFLFHINQGLRSGGGIADVLEPAVGDSYEFLRLCFDITFFFVVVVILLAIIQGLIVDAFGQLRDEEDSVVQEMQTKCFICGLGNNEFDHIPHGFDNHISKDHCIAHYMFLLLYLIKKRESEFSGQESFVWEMYLKRDWDIFPVGKCFQLQETNSSSETAN